MSVPEMGKMLGLGKVESLSLIHIFLMSQMWDCQEDRERIFRECKYQVVAKMCIRDRGHIEQYFGKVENVFHELVSPDIHVDICICLLYTSRCV